MKRCSRRLLVLGLHFQTGVAIITINARIRPWLADTGQIRSERNPRRDERLRSQNGSAPQPAAATPTTATENRWSELKTG